MQINPNYDYPSDDDEGIEAKGVDGTSPLSDRLAISGYFRASDPGRFEGAANIDNVSDIQMIARRESQVNRNGKSGKRKKRHQHNMNSDGNEEDKYDASGHI